MVRILGAGIVGVVMGVVWFAAGLAGTDPESPFSGGLWKGPIAFAAGVAALAISIRELARGGDVPKQFPVNPPATNPDGKSESR